MAKSALNYDAELHDWSIATFPQGRVIYGAIYNDTKQRFADGDRVRTSLIVELNRIEGFAKTLNTLYKLVGDES